MLPVDDSNKELKVKYIDEIADILTIEEIHKAKERIGTELPSSPLIKSKLSSVLGLDLFYKQEYTNVTGSFKERGARNAFLCLSEEAKERGVIAASAGNHAMALAYQGMLAGVSVKVVMPVTAPNAKILGCKKYNSSVLTYGQNLAEAKTYALSLAKLERRTYINGYDDLTVIAGAGTIGLDIVEQLPDIDYILVPVGGGGLLAGVCTAVKSIKPEINIIGIESENCAGYSSALNAGEPTSVVTSPTLADGLSVPCVGHNSFKISRGMISKLVVVNENEVKMAMYKIMESDKIIVEGSPAVCIAALLEGYIPECLGKRTVAIMSGANIDMTSVASTIEYGLENTTNKLIIAEKSAEIKESKQPLLNIALTLFAQHFLNFALLNLVLYLS